jgi:anti-sigma regulatory factor (Ser/Thr protein kinase)
VTTQEERREEWALPAVPPSVSELRRRCGDFARSHLDESQLHAFLLVLTEVVTNAIRHGSPRGGDVRVVLTPKEDYLCVQVTDSGAGFVPHPGAMESTDEGGFGLFLVEQLTRRWGITRETGHTRVWFELDFAQA